MYKSSPSSTLPLVIPEYIWANANKLTSRIFVDKSSPSSTLPLVIPEYI